MAAFVPFSSLLFEYYYLLGVADRLNDSLDPGSSDLRSAHQSEAVGANEGNVFKNYLNRRKKTSLLISCSFLLSSIKIESSITLY